jgi:hypothetical protein
MERQACGNKIFIHVSLPTPEITSEPKITGYYQSQYENCDTMANLTVYFPIINNIKTRTIPSSEVVVTLAPFTLRPRYCV